MKFKNPSFKMMVLISRFSNIVKFHKIVLFFNSLDAKVRLDKNIYKFMDTNTMTNYKVLIKKGTAIKQFLF